MIESHISTPVNWSKATFTGFKVTEELLIIFLSDESQRKMKRSWGIDTLATLKKIEGLAYLDEIYYGTWSTYDVDEWFCDVSPVTKAT